MLVTSNMYQEGIPFLQIQAVINDHHEVKAILEDIIYAHKIIAVHIHEVIAAHVHKVILLIDQNITLIQNIEKNDDHNYNNNRLKTPIQEESQLDNLICKENGQLESSKIS
ncbi:4450_t:CDS:2 [Dentiscutata erythropus]|uniref:4450_t:CDS:1 n=1 Tax=Dentiscutata erythropus TaxID=1348616 RepID=A0A9N9CZI0_9GLOM|nr:4450_t:CDS:2 [Dentiscutata erythropus]